jgi:hypothetical protein
VTGSSRKPRDRGKDGAALKRQSEPSTPRKLKPRPLLSVRPSFVSQLTVFVIFGISPRKFLEAVVPRCARVSRIGRTVLVAIDEAERVVRDLAADRAAEVEPEHTSNDDDHQPRSVNDVLRVIGKEVSP